MFNYLLYKLGIFLVVHAPLKTAYKIAVFIADLQFLISRKDRGAVIDNLKVILKKSEGEIFDIARSVFRNFAKYLVDFFRFSKIDENFIKKHIKVKNKEFLDNALKKESGVILTSAHLGNWELGAAIVSKLGYPISVIALDHTSIKVNNIFISQRSIMGVNAIPIGITLRKCFTVLKNNEALAVLGDRDFSTHGIDMKFFGRNTLIPKGPATFSLRTGAPIVPIFLLRNHDNSFTLIFEEEIKYQPVGDFDSDVNALTEKVLIILEDYIKKYPDQWYMFRRFWV